MIRQDLNEEKSIQQIKTSVKSYISRITVQFGETNPLIKENEKFPNNIIISTKYNLLTWGPKSLIMQFKRGANIYFLLISILTCMNFSPQSPASTVGTFILILFATMIKEAIEDYSKYQQDLLANERIVLKRKGDKWDEVKCFSLIPGDIVKVRKEEEFSADIILISTSNENGYSYIDTRNLDGETNLKEKACLEEFKNIDDRSIHLIKGKLDCDAPNENLMNWEGIITYNEIIFTSLKNFVLKGCVLKNTMYCIGIVVYSGKSTKIMKNSKAPKQKTSMILLTMNNLLYSVFFFEFSICLIFAILSLKWNENQRFTYLGIDHSNVQNKFYQFFITFLVFFVNYSHLIPISLYVALEIIKIFQGLLVYYDNEIYDHIIEKPAKCRATDLIEELGQVEFIFSDKTGTLTKNSMILKKCFINNRIYGNDPSEAEDKMFTLSGDPSIFKKMNSIEEVDKNEKVKIEEFLSLLALCHSVFPEKTDKGIIYQGSSPDDIALVNGAKQLGIEYKDKEFSDMIVYNHFNNSEKRYEHRVELPFDSNRKRMSVIVIDKISKEVLILSKGADTNMLNRIKIEPQVLNDLNRVNKIFSKEGLRVLILAKKILVMEDFLEWENRYQIAKSKNKKLTDLFEEIEKDLYLVGSTAIEDKLQDGVPDTIFTLISCGIRIWVLTGDKKDTAEEIAKSCSLINDNMFIEYFSNEDFDLIRNQINERISEFEIDINVAINCDKISSIIRKKRNKDMSILIDGGTLEVIFLDQIICKKFFYLSLVSKSVICCRVSPKQKAKVVKLAKDCGNWVTLSIGDGANDVPMIMEAHIGVGIQGKEGTQAVRSSDFSIGQFRFLQKLLLIYGRNGYLKISKFICYYFYKNIIVVFTELSFAFWNGFSGQVYFVNWLSTLYNAFWTSWPCLFTFSLEKDVNLLIVKKFPQLYECGRNNYYFNMKVFWTHILYAIFHGACCFFIPTFGLSCLIDKTGITLSHWHISLISFSMIIHIVNFKLLMISNYWNVFNLLSSVVSLLFYYMCLIMMCSDFFAFYFQNELAGIIQTVFRNNKFYAIILLAPAIVMLPDLTFKQIGYLGFPSPIDEIMKRLMDPVFIKFVTPVENKHNLEFSFVEKIDLVFKKMIQEVKSRKERNLNNSSESFINKTNNLKCDFSILEDFKKTKLDIMNDKSNKRPNISTTNLLQNKIYVEKIIPVKNAFKSSKDNRTIMKSLQECEIYENKKSEFNFTLDKHNQIENDYYHEEKTQKFEDNFIKINQIPLKENSKNIKDPTEEKDEKHPSILNIKTSQSLKNNLLQMDINKDLILPENLKIESVNKIDHNPNLYNFTLKECVQKNEFINNEIRKISVTSKYFQYEMMDNPSSSDDSEDPNLESNKND